MLFVAVSAGIGECSLDCVHSCIEEIDFESCSMEQCQCSSYASKHVKQFVLNLERKMKEEQEQEQAEKKIEERRASV